MNNENRFKETMLWLATACDYTLQPEKLEVYWEVLGKYSPNHLARAAKIHVETPGKGEWFPKSSQLIGHINEMIAAEKRQAEQANQLTNRIERKKVTPADKKRISKMIKGLIDEV